MTYSNNVQIVLDILRDEVNGDTYKALQKMSSDYSMTWMYQKNTEFFPSTGNDLASELEEAYPIKGRVYDIRNIAENNNVVMIEMIESYPDPDTAKIYRTPLIIVLELEDGRIRTGRHYCDPRLSFANLTQEQIEKPLTRTPSKLIIK